MHVTTILLVQQTNQNTLRMGKFSEWENFQKIGNRQENYKGEIVEKSSVLSQLQFKLMQLWDAQKFYDIESFCPSLGIRLGIFFLVFFFLNGYSLRKKKSKKQRQLLYFMIVTV